MKALTGYTRQVMSTEQKILDASNYVFLQNGYHGTTIQKISDKAGVGKSQVHYYFRSKDNLYELAIKYAADQLLSFNVAVKEDNEKALNSRWFIATELRNNKVVFLQVVDKLFPGDLSGIFDSICE